MTTEEWFDSLTAELLAQNPFRRSEYFKRFASGSLSREQVWGHIAQHYLLIAWFPRIFSGIHTRCDDFEVRKDCARHLLVEDLGYLSGQVGATPDHDELFRRIGDDLGYSRDAYDRIAAVPEMDAIVRFFQELAHERPWSASLCAPALLEEEVVEIARTVGRALVEHYGGRPGGGGQSHAAFLECRTVPFKARAERMREAAQTLRRRRAEFARTMALEMGKPIAQGEAEVDKCAWVCDYYADSTEGFLAVQPRETDAKKSYVRFDPLGVVLAVMPWNFPFWPG